MGPPHYWSNIKVLFAIMAKLQDLKQGCPWKQAQTLANIAPYAIEEAYEVADAIAQQDWGEPRYIYSRH